MLKIKLPISIAAGLAAVGIFCGGPAQALPTISNVYPNGTNLFQPSANLTFTANSGSGVTNIVVDMVITNIYTGKFLLAHLTSASGGGLTVSGSNVSAPLTSNSLYGASIKVYDVTGSATTVVDFDTITPAYTWEAKDWDYTSNNITGLFIDNPQVNQYAGLATTDGTDAHNNNGGGAYRPVGTSATPGGLATEGTGDIPRLAYIGTTNHDYDVGFTDGSDFGNYTRHYPAGTYILFGRIASGSGNHTDSAELTVQAGNVTTTNTSTPFKYGVIGNGWQNYGFYPITDSTGNPVQFVFDGNPATLRFTQNQAGDNMNFFMLMPVPVIIPSTVDFTNITPDGSVQFQASNSLSVEITSPVAITLNSVQIQLTATTMFGSNSTAILGIGSGLSYTGTSSDIVVTAPLTTNVTYSALILANDANGVQGTTTATFDTIVPADTFEAEDWNFGGGNWFGATGENTAGDPTPDEYYPYNATLEIDAHYQRGVGTGSAGGGAYQRTGLNTEGANDIKRAADIISTSPLTYANDYDLGNTSGGDWADYTRIFPAGTYNLFVRVSRGNSGTQTDAGKLSLVTSDPTQPNQTIQDLGKHNTPATGAWQSYVFVPIINSGGTPARLVCDGVTPTTLRYTFDGAGDNIGFFMLLPADLSVNPPPFVSSITPDSTQLFQPSNTLTFLVNSSVGIPQSGVKVNLNGVNATGLSFSGSSTLWTVNCPIKTNMFYTAIITVTDTAGTSSSTNVFATISPNSYQMEAEDYNYGGGNYFGASGPNTPGVPLPDSYGAPNADLGSVSNIDNVQLDFNTGRPFNYRADSSPGAAPGTSTGDVGGELPRANFTSGGGTAIDYDVGYFGGNSWLNYTRVFPTGSYYVMGRFAEGNNNTQDRLFWVNGDPTTVNQTTTLLGTFPITAVGWSSWHWSPLIDANGNLVTVTMDGAAHTLRMSGSPVAGQDEANFGFLALVATTPRPTVTATANAGNAHISFFTQSGYSYQVLYKNNLTDATWTALGSALSGNNAVQSVSDSLANGHRFYQVQIQ